MGKISAWFFKCRDFTQPIITENIQAVLKSLRRKRKLSKITSHWKWRSYLIQEALDPVNLFNLYTRPGWSQCIILHIIFSTLCLLIKILPKHCLNYLGTAEISKRNKKQSLRKILRGRQGLLWETCKWWIVGSRLNKGHCFFELRYVLRDEFLTWSAAQLLNYQSMTTSCQGSSRRVFQYAAAILENVKTLGTSAACVLLGSINPVANDE